MPSTFAMFFASMFLTLGLVGGTVCLIEFGRFHKAYWIIAAITAFYAFFFYGFNFLFRYVI